MNSGLRRSSLPVQRADEREQPSRRIVVDDDLRQQLFAQNGASFVVERAAADIDLLNACRRRGPDRLVIGLRRS